MISLNTDEPCTVNCSAVVLSHGYCYDLEDDDSPRECSNMFVKSINPRIETEALLLLSSGDSRPTSEAATLSVYARVHNPLWSERSKQKRKKGRLGAQCRGRHPPPQFTQIQNENSILL